MTQYINTPFTINNCMTAKEAGIHITTDGYEYDRIIQPIIGKYPVEKLVVFRSPDSPYTDARDLAEEFVQKVLALGIDVEVVDVNIYDFNHVFINTLKQINMYAGEGKKVYINISPVPKLATVAMMCAAFLSPYHDNLEIFYASPEEYIIPKIINHLTTMEMDEQGRTKLVELTERFMKKGSAEGVKDYFDIPVFPIIRITDMDREILRILKDTSGVDSIEMLVEHINKDRKEKITRSSIQYRLERLVENGIVDTERKERRLSICLNKLGEVYLEGSDV